MSLFGGILEGLFGVGGDPQIPEVDWEQLKQLMEFGIDKNRFNQQGLFTGNTWDADKGTLTTSINPEIQGGYDAMVNRANTGTPDYDRAGQFRQLLDAMQFGQQPERMPMPERRPTMTAPPQGLPLGYRPYGE